MADGYTKLFDISDSSLIELDIVHRYIFMWMMGIADFNGFFDGTVKSLARRANVPEKDMEEALKIFQEPDPDSRSRIEDGRRIIYQGGNRWWMVNKVHYRLKQSDSYRVFRDRLRQARKRCLDAGKEWDEEGWILADALKNGPMSRDSHHEDEEEEANEYSNGGGVSSNSSTDDSNTSNTLPRRVHVAKNPPTVEEVHEQILSRGVKANSTSWSLAEQIIEANTESGWRRSDGKPIYLWKSHVNQWVAKRMGGGDELGRLTPNVRKKFSDERRAQEQEEALRKEREAKLAARVKEIK